MRVCRACKQLEFRFAMLEQTSGSHLRGDRRFGFFVERARGQGFDAAQALAKFDSYPLFQAIGDAIMTGPTGNNVRDLRILLAY